MSELVYKKGEGWIYPQYDTHVVENKFGERFQFEVKPPEVGDRFLCFWKPDKHWFENDGHGSLIIRPEEWLSVESEHFATLSIGDAHFYYEEDPHKDRVLITVTKL